MFTVKSFFFPFYKKSVLQNGLYIGGSAALLQHYLKETEVD
tara:strand:+ start:516 stop:638 length:123 start_codon:yes stop_codon:yes gene_type:complete